MAFIASEGSGGGQKYAPHPKGQYPVICVDVIDLGNIEETWDGETTAKHKCRIRFVSTEEDESGGAKWLTTGRMTVSLNESANLRKFLKAWRGKDFTAAELARFDLETLIGAPAFVQVSHRESKAGRDYALIDTIMRLPKGQTAPEIPHNYVRDQDRETAEEKATAEADAASPQADQKGRSASAEAMDKAMAEPPGQPSSWGKQDDDLPF
jgi:hypothetical protein